MLITQFFGLGHFIFILWDFGLVQNPLTNQPTNQPISLPCHSHPAGAAGPAPPPAPPPPSDSLALTEGGWGGQGMLHCIRLQLRRQAHPASPHGPRLSLSTACLCYRAPPLDPDLDVEFAGAVGRYSPSASPASAASPAPPTPTPDAEARSHCSTPRGGGGSRRGAVTAGATAGWVRPVAAAG